MSCVNPNLMQAVVDDYTGLINYKFLGNARYHNPETFGKFEDIFNGKSFYVTIPCRHCLGCAIDYSRDWANRMCLELDAQKKAIFVTLTYNDLHVPKTDKGILTLDVRDIQLFFKRLRKYFTGIKIRYFLAGEYGPKTKRPHYHAIIYGLELSDFPDLAIYKVNELGNIIYKSKILEDIWQNGFITLAEVNYKTCAYVSRYVLKKHFSFNKHELDGAKPEFNLCSRRPGIGLGAYQEILDRDSDYITINTGDDVHTFPIPKAIVKKGKTDENYVDYCNILSYSKLNQSNEKLLTNLRWTEDSYDSYLRKEFKDLHSKMKLLPERS